MIFLPYSLRVFVLILMYILNRVIKTRVKIIENRLF